MENKCVCVYHVVSGDSVIEIKDTMSITELTDGGQFTSNSMDVGGLYVLLAMVLVCVWLVKKKSNRG